MPKTTDSHHTYPISPILLLEHGCAMKPNEVWVGDITYISFVNGSCLFLAIWTDLFSRRIIGWQLEDYMKEELVIAAFRKALRSRRVEAGLIIHSDRGGQYAGTTFRKLLEDKKISRSISRADNPYDNAFIESCFSRFKAELLQDGAFQNREDAATEFFEYIEMYYNTKRRHSFLNYECPLTFENNYFLYKT